MTHKSSLSGNIKIMVLILVIVILIIITETGNEFVRSKMEQTGTQKKLQIENQKSRCGCWITILIKNSLEIK